MAGEGYNSSGGLDDDPAAAPIREVEEFRHNARNQLNLIFGYLDLLEQSSAGPHDANQQIYFERIRSAATRIGVMISYLLSSPDSPANSR